VRIYGAVREGLGDSCLPLTGTPLIARIVARIAYFSPEHRM